MSAPSMLTRVPAIGLALLVVACAAPAAPPPRPPAPAPAPVVASPPPALDPAGTSGRIAALAVGALVIDGDSGALTALDGDGRPVAQRAIGAGAGLLAYDAAAGRAYVADRRGDRVVVVAVGRELQVLAEWPTPAEPFGVALTPDHQTVLVTVLADHALIALDARSGAPRWRATLAPEPRGVSVAPGGDLALVSSIATGALDLVELRGEHRVASLPFALDCARCDTASATARGTGVVQFVAPDRAVATFQRAVPEALLSVSAGLYGGSGRPPITQHVAVLTIADGHVAQRVARVADHQPRSLVVDPHGTAWIAGLGSESLLGLPGLLDGTDAEIEAGARTIGLGAHDRCGPDGAALAADGDVWLWCAFSRRALRVSPRAPMERALREGGSVAPSALSPVAHLGLELFYGTTPGINRDAALACASCHIDGGADGLRWQLGRSAVLTPALAGRLAGTAPYKWAGTDATLAASVATTIHRLGGGGLSPDQSAALVAYLLALPAPRAPAGDPAAIARGRQVFTGHGGCTDCHDGPAATDGQRHALVPHAAPIDTPSLIGVARRAPYYHDGSAATLTDLVAGTAMGGLATLTADERADLAAYLRSL